MTIELTALAYSTGLLILLVLIQANASVMAQGLVPMAGNRDNLPPPTAFQARTKRVVDNHREGLMMFAPLALIVAQTGIANGWTALGAQLFFYARLAHAILYVAGVPYIRPLAWVVGLAGTIMLFVTVIHHV